MIHLIRRIISIIVIVGFLITSVYAVTVTLSSGETYTIKLSEPSTTYTLPINGGENKRAVCYFTAKAPDSAKGTLGQFHAMNSGGAGVWWGQAGGPSLIDIHPGIESSETLIYSAPMGNGAANLQFQPNALIAGTLDFKCDIE